jgi:hypothetical protein
MLQKKKTFINISFRTKKNNPIKQTTPDNNILVSSDETNSEMSNIFSSVDTEPLLSDIDVNNDNKIFNDEFLSEYEKIKENIKNITTIIQFKHIYNELELMYLYCENEINYVTHKKVKLERRLIGMRDIIKIFTICSKYSENITLQDLASIPTEKDCDIIQNEILICYEELHSINKMKIKIFLLIRNMEIIKISL